MRSYEPVPDQEIPGWTKTDGALQRSCSFRNFSEAWGFMNRVALACEIADHHPTWTNTFNRVEILLSTHDANNTVTKKDVDLALLINRILGEAA
jgi:4a-hydroxytetrahydrobiopterin dehydratase